MGMLTRLIELAAAGRRYKQGINTGHVTEHNHVMHLISAGVFDCPTQCHIKSLDDIMVMQR